MMQDTGYKMQDKGYRKILLLLFILGLSGCGYHFIGQESEVLSGINAIAVPYFSNKSYEARLESYLTEALVDEFVKSRMVAIVDEGDADAVIRGKIENFKEYVISFDKNDEALEYRALALLEVTLERRDTGEVLWRNKELFHFEDYRVSHEIAGTEANKEQAIKRISAEIAVRIHDSIIEGF
jgi:outer membrane lipopolysaccharide assembly protein LptE/RlpB